MGDKDCKQLFEAVQSSRRGEVVAWSLAGVMLVPVVLWREDRLVWLASVVVFGMLALSAVMISFGGWVERHTKICMDATGLAFFNGLRKVQMAWEEIKQIRVHSTAYGDKIFISSDKDQFSFKTLGKLIVRGQEKDRMGFEKGQEILKIILERSGLLGKAQLSDGYSYYRE